MFVAQAFCDDQDAGYLENSSLTYSENQPLLEVKGGYFVFTDAKMRKIYNQGGFDIQVSGSYPVWSCLEVYGSIGYLKCSGKSLNDHQKTSIWEIPVSLGIKPVFRISSKLHYYFAIGPRYFYIHQHNDSAYVKRNQGRNGLGMFVNTGFNYVLCNNLFFDVFMEYSYEKMRLHSSKNRDYTRNIQVGRVSFEGGMGYVF